MQEILNALSKGLKSQMQPKMLLLMLWPMLLARFINDSVTKLVGFWR